MAETLKCITPVDGSVYVERPLAGEAEIAEALGKSNEAVKMWRLRAVRRLRTLLADEATRHTKEPSDG